MTQKNTTTHKNRFALVATFATIPVLLLFALLLATALLSYHVTDPAWNHSGNSPIQNSLGVVGAWYSDISFSLLGKMSYLLPIALLVFAVHAWFEKGIDKELLSWRLVMLMTAILSGCVLWTRHDPEVINSVAQTGGGALGAFLTIGLEKSIHSVPVIMAFSLIVFVISLSLLFNFPWLKVMEWIGRHIVKLFALLFSGFAYSKMKKQETPAMTATTDTAPMPNVALQKKIDSVKQTITQSTTAEPNIVEPVITEKKQPHFTIDRYQPEPAVTETASETTVEVPVKTPVETVTDTPPKRPQPISHSQSSEPLDLSYFGISDKPAKKVETKTPTYDFSNTEKPQPMWDSAEKQPAIQPTPTIQPQETMRSSIETENIVETTVAPTPIVQSFANEQDVQEVKTTRSEPSLFDLGRIKKATSVKRAAVDAIQSTVMQKNQLGSDMVSRIPVTETPTVSEPEPWGEPEPTPIVNNMTETVSSIVSEVHKPLAPIDFNIANDEPAVIEPTPELQESLRHSKPQPKPQPVAEKPVTDTPVEPVTQPLTDNLSVNNQVAETESIVAETIVQPMTQEVTKEREIAQKPIAQPVQQVTQQVVQETVSQPKPVEPVASIAQPKPAPAVKETTNATIGSAYKAEEITVPEQPYELPSINLLDTPPPHTNSYTEDMLADMALVLETTLKQFNVSATVMHVSPGPVITRFEIELAPGVQAKKISNLSQDLARALAVSRVRVEEVIPGSTYVGLEVPNKSRETVYFRDVVCSKEFQDSKSPLTVSLGSDTSGKPVVADLMKMPHALVAGTTGSGKSVCINVMLLSMLYKASPKDLRLIMVDPKMLEMSMYEDIPHLLTPVITDMNEAENALTWAVGEMERRYQLMSALKVRKIDAFNEQVEEAIARGEPIKDPLWEPNESVGYTHHPTLERLPFIVIVIDELADMMMVVGKQVEQLIARLTQKARAAGIHVVLATQRPSTDVLTGLIKANVPTRIAFQVSSGTDSRVIIDGVGAEKLLGHGDMLYVPPGASHPQRLHGAFVGDAETDRITNYLRSTGEPDYIAGITTKQDPETLGAFGAAEAAESKDDADPLYEEAVQVVLESGKASISSVQRQLRIGYNRAARMIEDMQEQGIVSEPVNGVRKVLGASHLVD